MVFIQTFVVCLLFSGYWAPFVKDFVGKRKIKKRFVVSPKKIKKQTLYIYFDSMEIQT